MNINKKELVDALDIVKSGLSTKEIISQTTSFIFKDGNIFTYNDEISVVKKFPMPFNGAIKATELLDFLKKVKNDTIDISFDRDTNEVLLKAGRAKAGFTIANEITLPLEEELSEKGEWKKLPKRFIKAIKFALPCASKDMSNPKLTCINLTKNGYVEATDNYRVVRFDMKRKFPVDEVIVPATSLMEVIKLSPKFVSQGKGWLHFKNDNDEVISCRVFDEAFVNVQRVIDQVEDGIMFTFPENLSDVLERAEVFTIAQSKLSNDDKVDITIVNHKLTVYCQSDTAWFKESIPLKDYKGENFSFSITPYLLKYIISETNMCLIMSHMLRFEGENWVYLSTLANEVA